MRLGLRKKFLLTAAVTFGVYALITAYQWYEASHLEGDARRINLAGQLHYRVLEISMLMDHAAREPSLMETLRDEINTKAEEIEAIIHGLTSGSRQLGLEPLEYPDALVLVREIEKHYHRDILPAIREFLRAGPQDAVVAMAGYDTRAVGFLQRADTLVNTLEKDHRKELLSLRNRALAMSVGFLVLLGAFVLLALRNILQP
ncbi:MAG: hypothetical protein D6778_08810, partial [Nitrospirae bacterium]